MKKAFTLAEVLITLGIIGVVAALTMPMLIGHFEKTTTTTKLKKFYSVMAQATDKAMSENGDWSTWDYSLSAKDFFNKYYASNLKVVKTMCKFSNNRDFRECGNDSSFDNSGRYMVLEDGTVFTLRKNSSYNAIKDFYFGIYPKGYQAKEIGGRTYFEIALYNLKNMKKGVTMVLQCVGFQEMEFIWGMLLLINIGLITVIVHTVLLKVEILLGVVMSVIINLYEMGLCLKMITISLKLKNKINK